MRVSLAVGKCCLLFFFFFFADVFYKSVVDLFILFTGFFTKDAFTLYLNQVSFFSFMNYILGINSKNPSPSPRQYLLIFFFPLGVKILK